MYNREYTPEQITELKPNEVFVFGSNLDGAHGGGAARMAYRQFGAVWGQGVGLQGQSYGIPTMHGGIDVIKPYVDQFIDFARQHQELTFLVTRIGCGIAGFKDSEIAPLFADAMGVDNIVLPKEFVQGLQEAADGTLTGGMTQEEFGRCIEKQAALIEQIRQSAHRLHDHVNQTYDHVHPYGFHLDMVAASVYKYGHEVCASANDVLPLFFGAYYHDSIEDARLTYNDVTAIARQYMDEAQAYTAAEIVYALTNDKGRTRAERAGERYYQGIRQTPYAPFVKLADRLANFTYSVTHCNKDNIHMKAVYLQELPHFLQAISTDVPDRRFRLPEEMRGEIKGAPCNPPEGDNE